MWRNLSLLHDKFILLLCVSVLLAFGPVAHSDDCQGEYKRSCYKHWSDLDGDGFKTREEVLIRDSLVPVVYDEAGKIESGFWICPYTGKMLTDPGEFDVDHVYSLKEAHEAGQSTSHHERKNFWPTIWTTYMLFIKAQTGQRVVVI